MEREELKIPFSKGILVQQLRITDLDILDAYAVAEKIEHRLIKNNRFLIKQDDLDNLILKELSKYGENNVKIFQLFKKWQEKGAPLIILLGGVQGVGKTYFSSILSQLFNIIHRLNTSVVLQVLKSIISSKLTPALHQKLYDAWKTLRPYYSAIYDEIILGYEEQSKYVCVGVESTIKRALNERFSMIIEGEHLSPKLLKPGIINHKNVLYILLVVEDEKLHRSYIASSKRFLKEDPHLLEHFSEIRKIQEYLLEETNIRRLPVIVNKGELETKNTLKRIVLEKLDALTAKS